MKGRMSQQSSGASARHELVDRFGHERLITCQVSLDCRESMFNSVPFWRPTAVVISYFLCIDPLTFLGSNLSKSNPKPMYKLSPKQVSFAHRRNDDGSFDSICPTCFQTITHSACEPDLQSAEDSHVCNPSLVDHYRGLSKAVSDYREGKREESQGILNKCGN